MRATKKFDINHLISIILFLFPIGLLALQGSSNFLFFILAIISISCLCQSNTLHETWDVYAIAIGLAFLSSVVAILLSQISHTHFEFRPYDGSMRFLLALPIYIVLRKIKIQALTAVQYGFPLGAIIALLLFTIDNNNLSTERSGSYFLNLIHFGDLALILGFLSLFSINLERKDRFLIIILKIVGLMAGIFLSLRSGSRGGWLAIPVLCMLWIALSDYKISLLRWLAVFSSLFLILFVAYFYIDMIHLRVQDFYSDISNFGQGNKDTSTGIRIQIWQAAIYLFQTHPLFGIGPEGFKTMMQPLSQSGMLTPLASVLGAAEVHNDFLVRAAELGIFGVLSLLSLFLVPVFIFIRALQSPVIIKRKAAGLGICLVMGFFIFGLTVEIFSLKMTLTFYSLMVTIFLAMASSKKITTEATPSS